jgi:class 3 adenylate cyclase/tetratricopeptide (TPR) repeat protein
MKCPKCQFDNRKSAKFCLKCGESLELKCAQCGKSLPPSAKFCDGCGQKFDEDEAIEKVEHVIDGERKHVTVLFSDLCGYTAMSEKLDPEEVKEITGIIFDEISKIISKYDGFIEKYAGDAIMALFGATQTHEDDPIRAIRAAIEIHERVKSLSPGYEKKTGRSLCMHTGINTGLVVTGQMELEKGVHGIAGDTVNIAARLSGIAKTDEIYVGSITFFQAEGHFNFESLEPTMIKGKATPIRIYKFLSTREEPRKIHRLRGLRADLIGRKAEMVQLSEAVDDLRKGKGAVFSVCGSAGTGKSRLVDEFKAPLDLTEIQWQEGHAYPYAQNIPYFPLINLMNRAFQIKEGDSPQKVKEKVETGLSGLIDNEGEVVPFIGNLYAIRYPETDRMSPEVWKSKLHKAIQTTLSALALRAPTVICLEDLHWADHSSLELIRFLLTEIRHPVMFICVYRPTVSVFSGPQILGMAHPHKEISLQELSSSETQDMIASLLKTEKIPADLQRFIQEKVEGNPFYLEEAVNSLIESKTLIQADDDWRVTRPITESEISATIHGVISARVDRLEKESKRILQEASVIGRTFNYEILKKISDFKNTIDSCLTGLERLDFIKTRSIQPELEYIFKHVLTQEVIYNGLLKKERREIHDRIAMVMETLFGDRLEEYYETMAFHYVKGRLSDKAVDYLIKSAEKCRDRYALEESHRYFKQAFEILLNKTDKSKGEIRLFVDILIKWAIVLHWRGRHTDLVDLFKSHENLLAFIDDKESPGIYFAWLGWALYNVEELEESRTYLRKSLELGKHIKNPRVMGYANAFLAFTCSNMGILNEAAGFGKTATDIANSIEFDPELFRFALLGLATAYWFRGDSKKTLEIGHQLIAYGQKNSDIRCLTTGHITAANGYMISGNYDPAIQYYQKAKQMSLHPNFSLWVNLIMGWCHLAWGKLEEAEELLLKVVRFDEKFGAGLYGTIARVGLGTISIARGNLEEGLRVSEEISKFYRQKGFRWNYATQRFRLARALLQMVGRIDSENLAFFLKKITVVVKTSPSVAEKAEGYLNEAIAVAKEIGAKNTLALTYFDLGVLQKAKKRTDLAREYISKAIELFEICEADGHLKEAKETFEALDL